MKRIIFIFALVCLLILVSADIASAQNHTQVLSVTNSPLTITSDGSYSSVLIRENSASPTAVFSITLAGSSTAINYPAGTQFVFYGSFSNGSTLGTIQATTSGPFSFVAVEASGQASQSVKNTIINSGGGGSMVYPGAGVPNSTGSAWGTSYVVGSTGSDLPQLSSGLLLASEIPNPSASTLGGVESLSVVAHNFLTGISTSGVPTQAQPAFSDITGTLTNSQLPSSGVTAGSYTISSITVNAQGIITAASSGSGSSFTVETNNTNNTSSTAVNFLTSTVNTQGLIITPSNPATTSEKFEITGNYSGPYSSLSGLPQLAVTISAVSHNFLTSYTSGTGAFTQAQPAFTDISGSLACGQHPALTGDATTTAGSCTVTVVALNGTNLAGLGAGILKQSGSGVPALAVSGTDYVVPSGNITGTAANLSGAPALPNGVTATTQAANDNSTKLATTAYVATAVAGAGGATKVFLTSDASALGASMANVTGLSFSVSASTNYQITCNLQFTTSSATVTPSFQWTGPASPTAVITGLISGKTPSGSGTLVQSSSSGFGSAVAVTGSGWSTGTGLTVSLTTSVVNGTNAGTVQLQADAVTASDVVLKAGSSCVMN